MRGELQLALLGNVEIRRDGVPVTSLSSSKAQALLFFLAVTGRPYLRPALAGLLWGEMPKANARGNLRKALANLRRVLALHLQISRQAVAFDRDSPYWLDVELFEAKAGGATTEVAIEELQEAVELYRGDLLEGFYVRQAPAFEEWVLAQQARLRELAEQALVSDGPDLIDILIPSVPLIARAQAATPAAGWLTDLEELVAQRKAGLGGADLLQSDLFEQYARLLHALARERPILLVLDDLQRADAGSLSLLFHLGRRLEHSQILIVGIYRPADVAMGRDGERHPLEPVAGEFQRRFGQIQVDLRQTEGRQFVEAFVDTLPNRLGTAFREAFYEHTRGHALFTVEMLRGMKERGDIVQNERGLWVEGPTVHWETLPARVEGVIGERIGRLPATLQETLKVASVEGEAFTAELVARVRAVDERETVRQLSSALDQQHRLVRSRGSQRLGQLPEVSVRQPGRSGASVPARGVGE